MPASGTRASFVSDGDGNRVKGTASGVTTVYIGETYKWSSTGWTKYYGVYTERSRSAGSSRVAMRKPNGKLYWLFGDHASTALSTGLGSTHKVANDDGSLYTTQLYKPWGEKPYPSSCSTIPTTYRCTGK